ncbi:hypothetical protein YC2023_009861 [Brassica napus]
MCDESIRKINKLVFSFEIVSKSNKTSESFITSFTNYRQTGPLKEMSTVRGIMPLIKIIERNNA